MSETTSEREFLCEARWDSHWARWEVWAWEEPYQGAITDSDVPGDRQRLGGGWTHEHLVGTRRTAVAARCLGRRALRQARASRSARSNRHPYPDPFRITDGATP